MVADESADACLVASDLLAQAEHDPDARPILVTTSETLIDCVELEIERQLKTLDTRHIAEQSLENGAAILCQTEDEAIEVTNALAPEHLELMGPVSKRCQNALSTMEVFRWDQRCRGVGRLRGGTQPCVANRRDFTLLGG